MRHITVFLSALILSLVCVSATFGQEEPAFDFYSRGNYRPEVPRPQSILRYDVGVQHTTYAQMEKVIESIAKAAPDRVKIFEIGMTNEYRMQYAVAISAPENMARLAEIKAANARLTDPRTTSPAEAQRIIQTTPAIAWMAYTIHGNESASFETMMQVIYQLAASNEQKTLDILKNNVVVVITGENPDGHERFATWYNSVALGNADRNAFEHREPWSVWGRFNRFRFDLNRDNIAATQVETRNMQKAFFEWNPHVVVDHHGQTSQFFFPPAALPINPNLPQPVTNNWLDKFGRANAAAFDDQNWAYYVRDIFDLFYPGYWDSYPSLNGAIGMTYETDGGGNKGLRWTRDDGTIVTFRSSIAKHYVASMTTLETLSSNREQRLEDFYDFRRNAMAEKDKLRQIVIIPDKDPVKAAELIDILLRARVEMKIAKTSFSSTLAHSYDSKTSPAEKKTFPAGSIVIDLNQPQRKIIKGLLEQDTPQDPSFVREQMQKFERNQLRGKSVEKEDYGFYDITAWSLPLAFNLESYWTEDASNVDGTMITSEISTAFRKGEVAGRAKVAYLIPYETDGASAMAIRLLKDGFRVNVATKTMNAGGRNWKPGTFVVRVSRNSEKVHDAIAKLATEMGIKTVSIDSGYSDEGDTPVGGENVIPMKTPKIAVLADEGVSQTSYGSLWWMLDKYGIEFTPMTFGSIRSGALKNYNVLILPDGQAGRYMSGFGAGGVGTLKDWARGGGNIITFKGASVFAALKDVGLTTSTLVGSEDGGDDKGPKKEDTKDTSVPSNPKNDKQDWQSPVLPPIASPSATAGKLPEGVAGAIMRARVDRTNMLSFGIDEEYVPVLLASGYFFKYSKEGSNVLVFEENPIKPLTISGFVWEGNTERLLKGTSHMIAEREGAGQVILFADDPFFRGIFRTLTRPFFNSILF